MVDFLGELHINAQPFIGCQQAGIAVVILRSAVARIAGAFPRDAFLYGPNAAIKLPHTRVTGIGGLQQQIKIDHRLRKLLLQICDHTHPPLNIGLRI